MHSKPLHKASASSIPDHLTEALQLAHPTWRPILLAALDAMQLHDPHYLQTLNEGAFLPSAGRIFAAFSLALEEVNYVLVGEGPYPREASATGYCFMDGAVTNIWSEVPGAGLSKPVNRATSLRNFIKMLLVAEGRLDAEHTGVDALAAIAQEARSPDSNYIQTLTQLQDNFLVQGFLLLNASLVFRPEVAPARDAAAWKLLLEQVFAALAHARNSEHITIILWGKIADYLLTVPSISKLKTLRSEHPYNLSFIRNHAMQALFAPLGLLYKSKIFPEA